MRYVHVAAGLIAANFAYQAIAGHEWVVAVERSFFQAVAVLCCWWSLSKRETR